MKRHPHKTLWLGTLAVNLLAASTVAGAADPVGPVPLWKGLTEGMSGPEVVEALKQEPGIQSVEIVTNKKTKAAAGLKVKYAKDALVLFDLPFSIDAEFDQGRLVAVKLQSGGHCAELAGGQFKDFSEVLRAKYPTLVSGSDVYDPLAAASALSRSFDAQADVSLTTVYENDLTTVSFKQAYFWTKPPAPSFSTSALVRLADTMQRTAYETKRAECGGQGDRRTGMLITYRSRASFEAQQQAKQDTKSAKTAAAANGL